MSVGEKQPHDANEDWMLVLGTNGSVVPQSEVDRSPTHAGQKDLSSSSSNPHKVTIVAKSALQLDTASEIQERTENSPTKQPKTPPPTPNQTPHTVQLTDDPLRQYPPSLCERIFRCFCSCCPCMK